MKWQLPILVMFIFSSCAILNADKNKNYYERYKSAKHYEYDTHTRSNMIRTRSEPLTDDDLFNFTATGCTITKLENFVPFIGRQNSGINLIIEGFCEELGYSSCRFLLPEIMGVDAGITPFKYGRKGDLIAFLYSHTDYNHGYSNISLGCGADIWIGLSRDGGKTWNKYFTGLYEAYPIYPKANSKLDFIVDDNTLQIEAALTREGGIMYSYIFGSDRYTLNSKNGYLVTFDLDTLANDSDGDGLTDVLEAAMMTDPYKTDTDGDGISDYHDPNPRNASRRTEMTAIYETLIDDMLVPRHLLKDGKKTKDWKDITPAKKYTAAREIDNKNVSRVITILTDDPDVMAVHPEYVRVIVMSNEEYAQKNDEFSFYETPTVLHISPLFKVDGESNMYLIDLMTEYGGPTMLLQKKGKQWRMINYGGTCSME